MASPDILLVGIIAANTVELYEASLALGFTPVVVLLGSQSVGSEYPSAHARDLGETMRMLPAAVAGTCTYSDLNHERIDKQWRLRRERHVLEAEAYGITNWVTLVHPSAHVSPTAQLGRGVFIGPLVSVASHAAIGDFTRIGRSSTIGHHGSVGSNSTIGPGVIIPGKVRLGNGVTVGPGAIFLDNIRVGDNSLVGAGSVVTRDVKEGTRVLGNPAKSGMRPTARLRKTVRAAASRLRKKFALDDSSFCLFGSLRRSISRVKRLSARILG